MSELYKKQLPQEVLDKLPRGTECEQCGAVVFVGDWPFCNGDRSKHVPATNFGEDPMEPYTDEMVSQGGEYFTTRAERRSFMAKNGLEYKDVSRKRRGRVYVVLGGK